VLSVMLNWWLLTRAAPMNERRLKSNFLSDFA
jgi:hypothetical protein